MDVQSIDKQTNNILNGTTDLSGFNQQEHAGICSAGPSLIGALIVCNHTRESLAASRNAAAGQAAGVSNWEIDEAQEKAVQKWAEEKGIWVPQSEEWHGDGNGVNYISDRLHLEDMHPANVFIDTTSNSPICIDCIVKFRRDDL